MAVVAALIWDTTSDGSKRTAGIRWRKTPGEIDRLNAIVQQKTRELVEESSKTGEPLSPEVLAVVNNPNNRVYKERYVFLPVFYFTLSTCFILFGNAPGMGVQHPLTILFCFLFEYFWYDLFSGVLHVNLDNPEFIGFPVLHEPCLEFQWHHHIPMDLTVKSYLETCGDLNVVVGILFGYFLIIGMCFKMNPTYLCLIGWKLVMAYFGQLCHCMSHMPLPYVPTWIRTLQRWGVMLSAKEHQAHHKSYDSNFCIGSGIANPLVAYLRTVTTNKWIWVGIFVFMLTADVPIANHISVNYLGSA